MKIGKTVRTERSFVDEHAWFRVEITSVNNRQEDYELTFLKNVMTRDRLVALHAFLGEVLEATRD